MAGNRVVYAQFENVSVTAVAQDMFSLLAGSANGVELHQICMSAGGVTSPAEIRLLLKRLPTTVTITGGTSITAGASDSGDTKTVTATPKYIHTTVATTSGTPVLLCAWQWNVLNEFNYLPAPEDRPICQASEAFVLNIPGAPAATTVSGWFSWREIP